MSQRVRPPGAVWLLPAVAGLALSFALRRRYRRDIDRIVSAAEAGGSIADTVCGPIEYGEAGEGEPLLMIHGAGGGYDQGIMIGREIGQGYRVIAPSRFGYLRTALPADSSPAAQADAHAALLDTLGIARCVVAGASAGAPSAIELALRHPERVTALILLVPRAYHPDRPVAVDDRLSSQLILRLIESAADFPLWLAILLARRAVVRFLGVPPAIEAHAPAAERTRISAFMRAILPLSRRATGLVADGAATIGPWPLQRVRVPTLVVSAEDDLFGTAPGAHYTAQRIPGAELEMLASGGHLMVGQGERLRDRVRAFMARVHDAEADAACVDDRPDLDRHAS